VDTAQRAAAGGAALALERAFPPAGAGPGAGQREADAGFRDHGEQSGALAAAVLRQPGSKIRSPVLELPRVPCGVFDG
jgi:hypothetical protein